MHLQNIALFKYMYFTCNLRYREGRNPQHTDDVIAMVQSKLKGASRDVVKSKLLMSRGLRFPSMWHFDKCRLRRACAASY